MMVMPSNNSALFIQRLARRYPGALGHLYSPGGQRGPYADLPYALDNGCFSNWDPDAYVRLLSWASGKARLPIWAVVPDVVGDAQQTLDRWSRWAPRVAETGAPLALAVQDKMKPWQIERLSPAPDVLFIGGTTRWKWETAAWWCREYPRVHVGRVNSPKRLWELQEWGAESCDGTGWLRGDQKQLRGLVQFLRKRKPSKFFTMFP